MGKAGSGHDSDGQPGPSGRTTRRTPCLGKSRADAKSPDSGPQASADRPADAAADGAHLGLQDN